MVERDQRPPADNVPGLWRRQRFRFTLCLTLLQRSSANLQGDASCCRRSLARAIVGRFGKATDSGGSFRFESNQHFVAAKHARRPRRIVACRLDTVFTNESFGRYPLPQSLFSLFQFV